MPTVSDIPDFTKEERPAQAPNPVMRRVAWTMVISMTVLLVLALLAVVWGFVVNGRALVAKRTQPAPLAGAAVAPLVSVILAPGARIVSARTEGGKLVLHVSGPAGDEVQVIDMASGALTSQVRTQAPR